MKIQNIREGFLELVYPTICVGCEKHGNYLCWECKKSIKTHGEICPVCHKPSPDWLMCISCKHENKYLEGIVIGFVYGEYLKKIVLYLKFYHIHHVAGFLSKLMFYIIITHRHLLESIQNGTLIITFVPSHRSRKHWVKGYNQSELLAKKLGELLGIPVIQIAKKHKYTRSQMKLNRSKRKTNLIGAYSVLPLIHFEPNSTLLIIDDITTTGSTILQLSKEIKKTHPDVCIWGAVVARNI